MLTNDMATDIHNIDVRVTTLEHTSQSIKDSLNRIESRFDKIDQRFDKVDQEIKDVRKELKDEIKDVQKELKNDIRTNFFWSLGAFIGVLGLVAHAFKWI